VKTSEVLRKAGDVLRERGWCQFRLEDDAGRVCLRGAVLSANGDAAYNHEEQLLRASTGVECFGADWNDLPSRTAAEAAIALDAAYVLALQEEGIEPEDVL
jgi:hypothetical protein